MQSNTTAITIGNCKTGHHFTTKIQIGLSSFITVAFSLNKSVSWCEQTKQKYESITPGLKALTRAAKDTNGKENVTEMEERVASHHR